MYNSARRRMSWQQPVAKGSRMGAKRVWSSEMRSGMWMALEKKGGSRRHVGLVAGRAEKAQQEKRLMKSKVQSQCAGMVPRRMARASSARRGLLLELLHVKGGQAGEDEHRCR